MAVISPSDTLTHQLSEVLDGLPNRSLFAAVHQAVRYMSHMNRAVSEGYLQYHSDFFADSPSVTKEESEKARELISTIEMAEGKKVSEMPGDEAGRYVTFLTDLMFNLTAKDYPLNAERGRSLLNQMRAKW